MSRKAQVVKAYLSRSYLNRVPAFDKEQEDGVLGSNISSIFLQNNLLQESQNGRPQYIVKPNGNWLRLFLQYDKTVQYLNATLTN